MILSVRKGVWKDYLKESDSEKVKQEENKWSPSNSDSVEKNGEPEDVTNDWMMENKIGTHWICVFHLLMYS